MFLVFLEIFWNKFNKILRKYSQTAKSSSCMSINSDYNENSLKYTANFVHITVYMRQYNQSRHLVSSHLFYFRFHKKAFKT